MKVIYIVIVNFNGHYDTIRCLSSLLQFQGDLFRIVVVDNSEDHLSCDHILTWLDVGSDVNRNVFSFLFESDISKQPKAFESKLLLIKSDKNRGFAAANNLAIRELLKRSDWDYVWLLNNDTEVDSGVLGKVKESLSQFDPNYFGLIGTKLFLDINLKILQGIGGKYNKWLGTVRHIGENEVDLGQFDNLPDYDKIADYPIGASMFASRLFLHSAGLMTEDYFLFFEELDWSIRAKLRGWRIGFLKDIKVFHKGGSSVNSESRRWASLLSDKCNLVNRVKIAKRFYPLTLFTIYCMCLAIIFNRIRRGQLDRAVPLFKVLFNLEV